MNYRNDHMFGWKYIFIILISLTSSHSYSCGNMSLQKAASYYLQKAAALWLSVVYCPILFQKPFCLHSCLISKPHTAYSSSCEAAKQF